MDYPANIKRLARDNEHFRRVVSTGEHSQLVLMSLPAGGEIGEQTHDDIDQTFVVVDGRGEALINGESFPLEKNHIILVPAGRRHNLRNRGDEPLKLYTIYAPPAHARGTIHHTRRDAIEAEKEEAESIVL
jgi:mannose-6-phosphate isomerase-like protein (cupin superfamily)